MQRTGGFMLCKFKPAGKHTASGNERMELIPELLNKDERFSDISTKKLEVSV